MAEPTEPYLHGDLAIDFAQRRATLGGEPIHPTPTGYRLLTYKRLMERVWDRKGGRDLRPMCAIVSKLRSRLGDDADHPTYVFTEPRVGNWVPAGEQ